MRSPRACLIASAAKSRSYSAPSLITRSTASDSCSSICAQVSSGTAGSPRRSSASNWWAASIAASPPFTATYMSALLDDDAARQPGELVAAGENHVDAAREARMVGAPLGAEAGRQAGDRQRPGLRDAGSAHRQGLAGAEGLAGPEHGRGGVGILVAAGIEGRERRQRRDVGHQREQRALGRLDDRRAGVEAQARHAG